MASLAVVFDLIAKDKASKEFRNVGDEAEKTSGRLGKIGKVAGGAALAGVAALGTGMVLAFKGGMDELSGNQQAIAQFTAGIKSTGGAANVTAEQMQSLADSIEAKTGTDGAAIVSGGALLATFVKVRNEAGKGNDVFNRATQAGVDLAARGFGSVESNAILLGKALNDPIKGLSALGKQGVTFTEEQKKTIASLVETGDTLGAQKIILAEIEGQVAGSAEAYGQTLPGQLARAKAAFEGVQENLVKAFLPVFIRVLDFLNDTFIPFVGKAFGVISEAFGKLVAAFKADGIRGVFAEIGDTIQKFLPVAQAKLEKIGKAFVEWVGPKIRPLLEEVGKLLGRLVEFMVGTVLPKLVEKLAEWGKAFVDWVGPRIPPLLRELGKLLGKLLGYLITDALPKIIGKLAEWAVAFVAWVGPAALKLLAAAAKMVGELVLYLGGKALTAIKTNVATWASAAVDWVGDAIKKMPAKLKALGDSIRNGFTGKGGILDRVKGWGGDIVDAIVDGIKGVGGIVGDTVKGLLNKLPGVNFKIGGGDGIGIGSDGNQPRGVQQMMATVRSKFPGTPLISGLRPGAVTALGNPSYHGKGRATDLPPSMAIFNWLRATYGAVSKELFFSPADAAGRNIHNGKPYKLKPITKAMHWDHIHWAMANGGVINEPVIGVGQQSGKSYVFGENGPETVTPGVKNDAALLRELQSQSAVLTELVRYSRDTRDMLESQRRFAQVGG